ncbi:MAG: hypothetical protein HYS13_22505 [Planctomycetia bacterium]|nr:hypothetical protein [Planctomycetia bacterium]
MKARRLIVAISALAWAGVTWGALGGTAFAEPTPPSEGLKRAFSDLEGWLKGTSAEGWHKYLKSDALREQLALGEKADAKVVKDVLAQYASGAKGLENQYFVNVRTGLEAWSAGLSAPTAAELPALVRGAAEGFSPVTAEQVAASKAKLKETTAALEKVLNGWGKAGAGWKEYLQFETLKAQVADDAKPDADALAGVLSQFASELPGTETAAMVKVREALEPYVAHARVSGDEAAGEKYKVQIEALAASTEALLKKADGEQLQAAGAALDWLEQHGQAKEACAEVRRHYWRPNLFLSLSAKLVTAGFNQDVNDTAPITDVILGTQIEGTGVTTGKVSAKLIPNDRLAVIHSHFQGTTQSDTTGYNSGATIVSRGTTSFRALKQVSLDHKGFHDYPATAAATTNASPISVDSGRGGFFAGQADSIAWSRVQENRGRANQIAGQHAAQRVKGRLDSASKERLGKTNDKFMNQFRKPLLKQGAFPQKLVFATTEDALRVTWYQALGADVAAHEAPPTIDGDFDMTVHVHETMLNNLARHYYGGRLLDRDQFEAEMTAFFGKVPERFQKNADDPPWEIRFTEQDPITIEFQAGDHVLVTIRGTYFRVGRSEPQNLKMNITALYHLEQGADGFKATRRIRSEKEDERYIIDRGLVEALPPDYQEGRQLRPGESALRRQLVDEFEKAFDKQMLGDGIQLPDRWKAAGVLKLKKYVFRGDWASAGWALEPAPEEPPKEGATSTKAQPAKTTP